MIKVITLEEDLLKEKKSKNWGGKRMKKKTTALEILTNNKFILHEETRRHHNNMLLAKMKVHSTEASLSFSPASENSSNVKADNNNPPLIISTDVPKDETRTENV